MRYIIIPNFLSPTECNELIELAKPRLQPSESWNVTQGASQRSDFRVSDQVWFARGENPLITLIEESISRITNTPVENGEGLQVVRYRKGGYFKQHMDTFDAAYNTNASVLAKGGQRAVTCMIYLNTLGADDGGATYFPSVGKSGGGLRVHPEQGKVFMWNNLGRDGKPDPTTLHSAEPILSETVEKWICTKWIRERQFVNV